MGPSFGAQPDHRPTRLRSLRHGADMLSLSLCPQSWIRVISSDRYVSAARILYSASAVARQHPRPNCYCRRDWESFPLRGGAKETAGHGVQHPTVTGQPESQRDGSRTWYEVYEHTFGLVVSLAMMRLNHAVVLQGKSQLGEMGRQSYRHIQCASISLINRFFKCTHTRY